MSRFLKNYSVPLVILGLSITGARLQNHYILLAMTVLIAADFLLVSFSTLKPKHAWVHIWLISISLLYQTTLMSPYLIGVDLHGEYYFAQLTLKNNYWDYSYSAAYNSSVTSAFIAPMITKYLHIPLYWVFKAVYPAIFSLVPLMLYFIYKRWLTEKIAFISTFFFMAIPTFFAENISNPKQMIGETFLLLMLFVLVGGFKKINVWLRLSLVGVLIVFAFAAHYSMGMIALIYLGVFIIAYPLIKIFNKRETWIKVKLLIPIVVIAGLVGLSYLWWVSSGMVLGHIWRVGEFITKYFGIEKLIDLQGPKPGSVAVTIGAIAGLEELLPESIEKDWPVPTPSPKNYFEKQDVLVQTALGLDFAKSSLFGKIFRAIQYFTQLLIIIGVFILIFKLRGFNPIYLGLVASSSILLLATVFLPQFSIIMNTSRFYHLSLLFLAPTLVLGGTLVLRSYKLLSILLAIYFFFTTGFVYEITGHSSMDRIDIPMFTALSGYREDIGGVCTKADADVRDYIAENDIKPIYSDLWGILFLMDKVRWATWDPGLGGYIDTRSSQRYQLIPNEAYIYLRERNERGRIITYWYGVGLRKSVSYQTVGLDKILEGRKVIYQSGLSKLYGAKE